MRVRRLIAIWFLIGVISPISHAAGNDAVATFDGTYFGQRERIDGLSGELCENFTLHSLTISRGRIDGEEGDLQGRVFANGFFTGTAKVFGLIQPFEGRIEGDSLLGGIVSPDGACFWLMRMTQLEEAG